MTERGPAVSLSSAGVMRGAGRQVLASILNLITYWVLGLPLAILLAVYFNLGVEGLWWALLITTSIQASPSAHAHPRCERHKKEQTAGPASPAETGAGGASCSPGFLCHHSRVLGCREWRCSSQ